MAVSEPCSVQIFVYHPLHGLDADALALTAEKQCLFLVGVAVILCQAQGKVVAKGIVAGIVEVNDALLRALAAKTPIVVLTDPDGAGKLIRAHIGAAVPKERIIPLYVPQKKGTEKRKQAPSAEGFLGVEGQDTALLFALLEPLADGAPPRTENHLSKVNFFEDRLTGCENATARRAALAAHFNLPTDMTPNALLAALNVIATYDEYKAAVEKI